MLYIFCRMDKKIGLFYHHPERNKFIATGYIPVGAFLIHWLIPGYGFMIQNKKNERPTSNIQRRTSNDCTPSVFQFFNLMERHAAQAPALRERYPYSTFDVERSMLDVQVVTSEISTELS